MIASALRFEDTNLASALDSRKDNWETISTVMAKFYSCGGDPWWDEYHKEHLEALSLLQLPSYPFDMTSHWVRYGGDWSIHKNQISPS